MIKSFSALIAHLSEARNPKRLVVVYPHDEHSMEAVFMALREGWVKLLLVGDKDKMPLPDGTCFSSRLIKNNYSVILLFNKYSFTEKDAQ